MRRFSWCFLVCACVSKLAQIDYAIKKILQQKILQQKILNREFQASTQSFVKQLMAQSEVLEGKDTPLSGLISGASERTRNLARASAIEGCLFFASVNVFLIRLLISLSLPFASRVKHERMYLG